MSAQVLKYAKTVYQLEKGLPPNGVVPQLKAKVENMKDKVMQQLYKYCLLQASPRRVMAIFHRPVLYIVYVLVRTQYTCT